MKARFVLIDGFVIFDNLEKINIATCLNERIARLVTDLLNANTFNPTDEREQ